MIRKYKISNKNGTFYFEAESPQKAIEKMYKHSNIQIEVARKENATYKTELLHAGRISENYYIVCENTLSRKVKPDNYIEPMPKRQLQKIIKSFKAKGGIIKMDEDSEKFLKSQNSEAVTLNKDTILLTKNPGRSAVYEELIHAEQYRQGKNDGSYEQRLICEIEAQKILIEKKKEYNITDEEDRQTRLALKAYEKEYKEFIRR